MNVFQDSSEDPQVSWADEMAQMPGPKKQGIPRHEFILRPKVFFSDCSCWGKERSHTGFYFCWLDKLKTFIAKQRMGEYVDGAPVLCDGPHGTKSIRVICTANAARKITLQGPNIMAAYDMGRV